MPQLTSSVAQCRPQTAKHKYNKHCHFLPKATVVLTVCSFNSLLPSIATEMLCAFRHPKSWMLGCDEVWRVRVIGQLGEGKRLVRLEIEVGSNSEARDIRTFVFFGILREKKRLNDFAIILPKYVDKWS